MERKKLYKAKKNWVIGLATSLVILGLGTNIANADDNANFSNITVNQSTVNQSTLTNNPEATAIQANAAVIRGNQNKFGASSSVNINSTNSYNSDNVGYINPNSEKETYNNQPKYYLQNRRSYKYRRKTLDRFAQSDNLLTKYGKPKVYENLNGTENPYKYVNPQPITDISATKPSHVHYLNNGVSNSIHFSDTDGDKNYAKINKLSKSLSYADYKLMNKICSKSFMGDDKVAFFDGNKQLFTSGHRLTSKELNSLYKVAYKNRPIITFDDHINGHHITSLLQSSITFFNDGWKLTFDNGWRGYTFMDGKQIDFASILRENGRTFSWKNNILKYFAQSLAYSDKVSKENEQKSPFMLTGSDFLPTMDALSRDVTENLFCVSPTEFIFTKGGIYAIVNVAMGGIDPVFVHMPIEFFKPEYQYFTVQFVNIDNNKTVGKEFTASKSNFRDEVLKQMKGKYLPVWQNGIIKSNIVNGIHHVFVKLIISGSVDVSKDNERFEEDKFHDYVSDLIKDKATGLGGNENDVVQMISGIPTRLGILGYDMSKKGLTQDNMNELLKTIAGIIGDIAGAVAKSGGGVVALTVKDVFPDAVGLLEDTESAIQNGLAATNNEKKAAQKYKSKRDSSNFKDRKSLFKNTRDKQMNSIFSGFSAVNDAAMSFVKKNPVTAAISGIIGAAIAFALIFLTKYLWAGKEATQMQGLFGLKIKGMFHGASANNIANSYKAKPQERATGKTLMSETEKGNAINGGHAGGDMKGSK